MKVETQLCLYIQTIQEIIFTRKSKTTNLTNLPPSNQSPQVQIDINLLKNPIHIHKSERNYKLVNKEIKEERKSHQATGRISKQISMRES